MPSILLGTSHKNLQECYPWASASLLPTPMIYLIGSLRNPQIPEIAQQIRGTGLEVFDDWFAAGPIADDSWQAYEKGNGTSYPNALKGYAARHVFDFDYYHLNRATIGVLALPAGRSGHMELGYLRGQNKPTFVLFDKEPERWDVMYSFCKEVFFDINELCKYLKENYGKG